MEFIFICMGWVILAGILFMIAAYCIYNIARLLFAVLKFLIVVLEAGLMLAKLLSCIAQKLQTELKQKI